MYHKLEELILEWDGVHMAFLQEVYEAYGSNEDFFPALIKMCNEDETLQVGATWLIKNLYDSGGTLTEPQIDALLDAASVLHPWEARLHMMQILPSFEVTKSRSAKMESFIRSGLDDDKKFVKAAAFQAFHHLAIYQETLVPELKQLCTTALDKESASVKVKIRRILNALK